MNQSQVNVVFVDTNLNRAERIATELEERYPHFQIDQVSSREELQTVLTQKDVDCLVVRDDEPHEDSVDLLDSASQEYPSLTTVLIDGSHSTEPEACSDTTISAYVTPAEDERVRQLGRAINALAENETVQPDQSPLDANLDTSATMSSDAILSIDEESTIQYANPGIEEILGYSPDELVGESLTMLMPERLRDQHRTGFSRYIETEERQLDWDDIELPGRHKDGREVPLTFSFNELLVGDERHFVAVVRDISDGQVDWTERDLLYQITRRVAEAPTFEDGISIAVEEVGDAMNWAYGEAWLKLPENNYLELSSASYCQSTTCDSFREASEDRQFAPADGLPGRVWASGEPEWMPDVSAEPEDRFYRTEAATEAGLGAALGVPIGVEGQVVAVLVFLMSEEQEADERMIEATMTVATDLGRLLRRKRAESALREERNLNQRLVETSPVGIVIIDADGVIRYANDRAKSITGYEGRTDFPQYEDLELQTFDEEGNRLSPAEHPYRVIRETREPIELEVQIRRPDGERRWLSVHGAPLGAESSEEADVVFAFQDITERKHRQDELERYEAMLETVRDGVYALDDEDRFIGVNNAYVDLTGYARDELLGTPAVEITGEDVSQEVSEIQHRLEADDGDAVNYDTHLGTKGGDEVPVEARISLFPLGNGEYGRVGVVRDVTEQRRREEQLAQLNELAQSLATAQSSHEVCNVAVEAARETLSLPLTAIEWYDEQEGELTPVSRTEEVVARVGENRLFDGDSGVQWKVYSQRSGEVYDDLVEETEISADDTDLRSAIVLPLGSHGVLITGSTEAEAFTETDVVLASILAANVEAALERTDREETLRDRKEELEDRTMTLERVNRINDTIRDLTVTLTNASTREEIEQAVCTKLANAEPFRFVWIGEQKSVSGEIVPKASAGVERGYLDTITVTADDDATGQGPTGRAIKTHEPEVQNNLHSDPPFEPWRSEALSRGYRASVAIPLYFRETLYGVMNLYASEPGVFDDLEVDVLSELGEMIGFAFNAIERKKALVSDQAVKLEFALNDLSIPIFEFTRETGGYFEMDALIEQADGSLRMFFTVAEVDPETVSGLGDGWTTIRDVNFLSDRDGEYLFEGRIEPDSFLGTMLDYGAHPTELSAGPDGGSLAVELPRTGDIRAFLDMFLNSFEGAELTARGELNRPIQTEEEFQAVYKEQLTERQEEVMRTAFYAGFFDWPRQTTGSEVAELLDVSQPTVNRHIRKGEHKLIELAFEGPNTKS